MSKKEGVQFEDSAHVRHDHNETWFCPNGHEVFTPRGRLYPDEIPECGSCGREMSTDSTSYDEMHDWLEAESIREFEERFGY